MNLLHSVKGSTYWTADHKERVRIEFRVGLSEMFECSVFNMEGEHIGKRHYHANGVPSNGHNIYDKRLCYWNPVNIPAQPIVQEVEQTTHGVAATAGHLQSNGGLRGHSVGDVFPYIPFFKGPNYEQWLRCPNGKELGPFKSIKALTTAIRLINQYEGK